MNMGTNPSLALRMKHTKLDLWSDFRDNALDAIGIDQNTRDQLQPVVDSASAIAGQVFVNDPPPVSSGFPFSQAIGNFSSSMQNFLTGKTMGIPNVIIIVAALAGVWYLGTRAKA